MPPDPEQPEPAQPALQALRAELDLLDDQMHDLLMQRAGVVAQIAASGVKGAAPFRPGREAAIIRRLLARHAGPLPPVGLVRIWRAMLNAFTAQQRPVLVTVCEPEAGGGYLLAAREHFGALTPMRALRTPAQAIREVSAGVASAAVLPMPADGEAPSAAWWTALLQRDDPRIHVVARLPFWAARPDAAPGVQALVVCAAPPDPSGEDRSLIGMEVSVEVSRARLAAAVASAGFGEGTMVLRRDAGAPVAHALLDVDGFVTDADPRLARVQAAMRPPVVLGAYAVPAGAK